MQKYTHIVTHDDVSRTMSFAGEYHGFRYVDE